MHDVGVNERIAISKHKERPKNRQITEQIRIDRTNAGDEKSGASNPNEGGGGGTANCKKEPSF